MPRSFDERLRAATEAKRLADEASASAARAALDSQRRMQAIAREVGSRAKPLVPEAMKASKALQAYGGGTIKKGPKSFILRPGAPELSGGMSLN